MAEGKSYVGVDKWRNVLLRLVFNNAHFNDMIKWNLVILK